MTRNRLLAGLLAAALLVVAPVADAGSLEIGPISIQMIGAERTATLTIRNSDSEPVTVQIRTVDWSQADGADVYAPSTTLMTSPPLVTLAPGESQVIRMVIEDTPNVRRELAFRLILDEIPSPGEPLTTGVDTALRVLVPVFVTPTTADRPSLRWSATRSGDQLSLTAINEGQTRERLLDLQVASRGQPLTTAPLDGYILSGGQRTWTMDLGSAPAGPIAITAAGEFGPVEANVAVAP